MSVIIIAPLGYPLALYWSAIQLAHAAATCIILQDILHARFATTGVVEYRFKLPSVELKYAFCFLEALGLPYQSMIACLGDGLA